MDCEDYTETSRRLKYESQWDFWSAAYLVDYNS